MRGGGAWEATKRVSSSPRRCPSRPYRRVALRPGASRPRESSAAAASSRSEPSVPSVRSGQTTSRRASRVASPVTQVTTATGVPVRIASATAPSSGNADRSTRSTNTSMMPPQVSPTANASSSMTPFRCQAGVPVAATSLARSYTAPSTQPPETLPTAEPSGPTSIVAPGGRGAERQVATTVAMPTGSPARHQRVRSASTSRTGDHLYKFFQRRETVAGDEVVQVRQGGGHPAREGRVAGLAAGRVDPDQPVGQPGQPPQLGGQVRRVAELPALAADHHHGTPVGSALSPAGGARRSQRGAAQRVGAGAAGGGGRGGGPRQAAGLLAPHSGRFGGVAAAAQLVGAGGGLAAVGGRLVPGGAAAEGYGDAGQRGA